MPITRWIGSGEPSLGPVVERLEAVGDWWEAGQRVDLQRGW